MPVRDSILAMIYDFKHDCHVREVAIAPQMDLLLGASCAKIRYIGWVVGFLRELLQWQHVFPYKVG